MPQKLADRAPGVMEPLQPMRWHPFKRKRKEGGSNHNPPPPPMDDAPTGGNKPVQCDACNQDAQFECVINEELKQRLYFCNHHYQKNKWDFPKGIKIKRVGHDPS